MPRPDETSITMKRRRADRWRSVAVRLGYGQNGRQELLDVMLDAAEALAVFFRKR